MGNNKKRIHQSGFTLIEMLCVVILVSLLSMGMATGVSLAQKEFKKSMQRAQAPQLFTTLESILTNELRYTTGYTVQGENVETFFSVTYALKKDLTSVVTVDEDGNGYGQIVFKAGETYKPVLGQSAYPDGLGAKVTRITWTGSYFTVHLEVGSNSSSGALIEGDFDVIPLNDPKQEGTS
ncbi:MAG: type II secretion system protein [Bulleidia sp.]|nr:type II secretion system protein [Bulleidia sp.]